MPYTSNIIPLMTAANTPYGVASADSNLGSFYPYKAFDRSNIETDSWVAAVGTRWLSFQFPASAIVTRYATSDCARSIWRHWSATSPWSTHTLRAPGRSTRVARVSTARRRTRHH